MHVPPPPTDSPPAGRLCSRIEALKKELRLGLGKDLFTKAYSVLEGGLDTENEGVSEGGGVPLSSGQSHKASSCCTTLHTRMHVTCKMCMLSIHTDMYVCMSLYKHTGVCVRDIHIQMCVCVCMHRLALCSVKCIPVCTHSYC